MNSKEIYISVDIEATGPIPGEYSMFQLGACVIGRPLERFFTEITLLNNNFVPEALEVCGVTINELKKRGIEPDVAMKNFGDWVRGVSGKFNPVFVAFNATFDWMFVHWYFHKHLIGNPFGISGLDIKAYYMGMMGCSWEETKSSKLDLKFRSSGGHIHNALEDATEQAGTFQKIMDHNKKPILKD